MNLSDYSFNEPSILVEARYVKRFARNIARRLDCDLNLALDEIAKAFHPRIYGYASYEHCKSFDLTYSQALEKEPELIIQALTRLSASLGLAVDDVIVIACLDPELKWQSLHSPEALKDKKVYWIRLQTGKEMVVAAGKKKTARELFGVSQAFFRDNYKVLSQVKDRPLYELANQNKFSVLYRFNDSPWSLDEA